MVDVLAEWFIVAACAASLGWLVFIALTDGG